MIEFYNFACKLYGRILHIIQVPDLYDYPRTLEVFYNFLRLFFPVLPEIPSLP